MNNKASGTFALIVAAGIFFTYVSPTWSGSIAAKRAAIASDEQSIIAANTYKDRQNELAAARNEISQADLDKLAAFLPNAIGNIALVHDLDVLATRSGITLSAINVTASSVASDKSANASAAPGTMASPIGSSDFTLSAVGTYNALQTFLKGIEGSQRLLDVKDIVIKGSDTGVYTYQMKISLYWLR